MGWLASFAVAVVTGAVGLLVGGFLANLAVSWYRISSFEGGSGYFVVMVALLSAAGGAVIGLVAARIVAGWAEPGMLKALGVGLGAVLAIGIAVAIPARLLADVPPTIGDDNLYVAVEVWLPSTERPRLEALDGFGTVTLHALAGRTSRRRETGPLFTDRIREEDGGIVVPGVVSLFTERGGRMVEAQAGDSTLGAAIVAVPRRPGPGNLEWSGWQPISKAGATGPRLRFRVQRESEPIREDRIGPFAIATVSSGFFNVTATPRLAAWSTFRIEVDGSPIPGIDDPAGVAVLGGAPVPALLASGESRCHLITAGPGGPTAEEVGSCPATLDAWPLTADQTRFDSAAARPAVPGWIERQRFATPGLYFLQTFILDTRTLGHWPVTEPDELSRINGLPPAALSPDERSYVWYTEPGERPMLAVTRIDDGTTDTIPIDRERMRYRDYRDIGPDWVLHHFAWRRGADGFDHLAVRPGFTPLPHRGTLTIERADYASYSLTPGGAALRSALVQFMVDSLGGERMPDELNGYHQVVRIDGKLVKTAIGESNASVTIGMDYGSVDTALVRRIGAAIDAALATGRYDSLFGTNR